jgi:(4S)-4-hydroxy-5-phosphonooxypentane-2,3-dione isomerase
VIVSETPCTLTVSFDIVAKDYSDFLAHLRANAALSLTTEPGCLRFDVLVPLDDAPSVLLYEIYRSRADFDLHLATDHYLRFDAATHGMVRSKTVEFHRLLDHAQAAP